MGSTTVCSIVSAYGLGLRSLIPLAVLNYVAGDILICFFSIVV
ncbi:hypothetical protein [Sodalis endosymbiont of Henestaris halophilus]|nr:hypothetical protein HBA_0006 [Sodalis endosymbiont of Henestaris halophilus]